MKFLKCLGFLLFFSFYCFAQKNFFLYIQTENKQPFSARMDGRIYSSTEMGYLIIPKLFAGEYPITIDFPKNIITSQQFDISINHQDLGFVLKNIELNGWVLQNLQTSALISAKNNNTTQQLLAKNDSDDFTKTLSQISNTPLPEEKKINTEIPVEKNDFPVIDSVQVVGTPVDNNVRSDISLIFSSADTIGRSLIYSISQSGFTDTVMLFIPFEKEILATSSTIDSVQVSTERVESSDSINSDTLSAKTEKTNTVIQCTKTAEDKDFLQLRKKMASQDNENDMILQAEKTFKSRCFSTQQVRNLAGLFLEDNNRLNFLLMSRLRLTDPENFGSLVSLLSEESNILKFKEVVQ